MGLRILKGENDRERFSELLDISFSLPQGGHFLDDFPVWDEKLSGENVIRFGVFEKDRLAACAGVRLARLQTGHGPVRVALIGAVATHPDFRGKGLASELTKKAIETYESRGVRCGILWGSEHELYGRFGFKLFGKQVRVNLGEIRLPSPGPLPVRKGWNPALFELMKKRGVGIIPETGDQKWISSHRNVEWRYLEGAGRVDAFLGFGRGIDLKGMVHEWWGDRQALGSLLSTVRSEVSGLQVLGPWALLDEFGLNTQSASVEGLCLARFSSEKDELDPQDPRLWFWGLDAC